MLSSYTTSLIILSCIGALQAWSFYFPLAVGRLFAGQVGFMAIGAYLSAFTLKDGWPLPVVVLLVALTGALVAALVSVPFRNLSGFSLAVSSLAFAEVVRLVISNNSSLGGVSGVAGIPLDTTLGAAVTVVLVVFVVLLVLQRSPFGATTRAIREDTVAAAGLGIRVGRVQLAAMAMSGCCAAMAGALFGSFVGFIAPDFGFDLLVTALVFALVGGTGTVVGPLVGAAALTVLPEALRVAPSYRLLLYGALIALVVLFLPRGLTSLRPPFLHAAWQRRKANEARALAASLEVSPEPAYPAAQMNGGA